jgi:hypothetical protein
MQSAHTLAPKAVKYHTTGYSTFNSFPEKRILVKNLTSVIHVRNPFSRIYIYMLFYLSITQKNTLINHRKTHTSEIPLKCTYQAYQV